ILASFAIIFCLSKTKRAPQRCAFSKPQAISHKLSATSYQPQATSQQLDRHDPHFLLHLGRIHHDDGIPGTPIQEAPIRPLADALLASNAQDRVDLDAPERRM